jgi:hypothetical protein
MANWKLMPWAIIFVELIIADALMAVTLVLSLR